MQQSITSDSLSERELSIIQFIHEFGFCEVGHIMQRFSIGRSNAYAQMKMLTRFGMVKHMMVLPDLPGVYFLMAKAVRLINSDLLLITYVPIHYYSHYMKVLHVYLKVHEKHPDATWITERRLIRQKQDDMPGNKEHLPDGILILPDEKRIAIEVELSVKARDRLLNILTDYEVDKTIHEVWYFCSPKVLPVLRETAASLSKIKTFLLIEE